jgi:mannose/fructose-specific phosphotransferase system component IIA
MSIAGILVGHRDFPIALLNAAESIMGKQDNFQIVSNEQCSGAELKNRIESAVNMLGNQEIIIFVDLLGGSCGIVSGGLVKQTREKPLAVFCNVSLPVLIKFFQYRDKKDFKELLETLEKTGRDEIRIIS